LKKLDDVTRPCPFQGRFIICRLVLAMLNSPTKFEVSTIIGYEDMKRNAKCTLCLKKGYHLTTNSCPIPVIFDTSIAE